MTSSHSGHFPIDKDLTPLVAALRERGVVHRITEKDGQQVLMLAEDNDRHLVDTVLTDFERGHLSSAVVPLTLRPQMPALVHLANAPVTLVLVCLGVVWALAIEFRWLAAVEFLSFASAPLPNHVDSLLRNFVLPWESGQWWRVLTPVFLHFSWMHILFNSGALLQVGSWLERYWGPVVFSILCLVLGVGSNLIQYWETPSPLFGGLSGIVFGLFTFNGVTQLRKPSLAVYLPKGMYIMLGVWLIAGYTPIFEWLFGVSIANGAHLGGAVLGAIIAFFIPLPRDTKEEQHND